MSARRLAATPRLAMHDAAVYLPHVMKMIAFNIAAAFFQG